MTTPRATPRRRRWWLLLFLAWPAAELISLAALVDRFGGAAVAALVLATAILGVLVMVGARRRWHDVTASLRPSRPPVDASGVEASGVEASGVGASVADILEPGRLSDPALTVVAGLLLVLPGPIGDALGLVLLIPGVRALVAASVAVKVARHFPQAASGLRTFRIRSSGTIVTGETWNDPSSGGQDGPQDPPPALPPAR